MELSISYVRQIFRKTKIFPYFMDVHKKKSYKHKSKVDLVYDYNH